ncbi:hypothetical protein [Dactylosporangium cerinum]
MSSSALSAAAAIAAAVISLATLVVTTVVTSRREQHKWVRNALTDAFVAFLDASWRGTDALAAREGEEELAKAYADMRSNLTRLRLLASAPVVATGVELLRSQRAAMTAQEGTTTAALEQCTLGRRKVVEAAKQEMGLR